MLSVDRYRLNFYITGVDNYLLDSANTKDIKVMRKGEVCNKRTGRKYIENIVKKTFSTTYEEGFGPAFDKMIKFIKTDLFVSGLLKEARSLTFQVCVDLDDECNVPAIEFTSSQLSYLVEIGAGLEFHIS